MGEYIGLVNGKKFMELKEGKRRTDLLTLEKKPVVGSFMYYTTDDESLQDGKLLRKVIGDVQERANGKYRVSFVGGR